MFKLKTSDINEMKNKKPNIFKLKTSETNEKKTNKPNKDKDEIDLIDVGNGIYVIDIASTYEKMLKESERKRLEKSEKEKKAKIESQREDNLGNH